MKGIDKYEKAAKRGSNFSKQQLQAEKPNEEYNEKKVIGQSQRKLGSFFTGILEKTRDWMSDDIE